MQRNRLTKSLRQRQLNYSTPKETLDVVDALDDD